MPLPDGDVQGLENIINVGGYSLHTEGDDRFLKVYLLARGFLIGFKASLIVSQFF